MTLFDLLALLLSLAAVFSYLNARYIRLPNTIGVMLISLVASLVIIAAGHIGSGVFRAHAASIVAGIDFDRLLLHGMLAYLLFAGSLHVDLSELAREWLPVSVLALVGTVLSTFAVAYGLQFTLHLLGTDVPTLHCLLFGALISPTDPIAVLGIMKQAGAPKSLETQISGESLFNDGIGVVIFLVLLELVHDPAALSFSHVSVLLAREALGGALVGLAAGLAAYRMLKRLDNYQVEVLITLALATATYALAERLHVSAPIAAVVAGLFIGNQGRHFAMSKKTEEHLDTFWELVDEILNALLFMLMGLQLLVMPYHLTFLYAGLAAIVVTLGARLLAVASLVTAIRTTTRHPFSPGAIPVLTWGGLRGGISVAMALSLPPSPSRDAFLATTYSVVIFSVLVQGLTVGKLIRSTATPRPHLI
jgi:CPA1 family monovalent cation:H+ antiporter